MEKLLSRIYLLIKVVCQLWIIITYSVYIVFCTYVLEALVIFRKSSVMYHIREFTDNDSQAFD